MPAKINPKKDCMELKSIFWEKVEQEFDKLSHEDPGKVKIIEYYGILKCVATERRKVLRSMRNMIEFYQHKVDVLCALIVSPNDMLGMEQFLPLLCSHYHMNLEKVNDLQFLFEPFLKYDVDSVGDNLSSLTDYDYDYASDSSESSLESFGECSDLDNDNWEDVSVGDE